MHIVIVEDDQHLRRGICDLLTLEGFDCTAIGDGETALAQLDRIRPDFYVLDVMLPGADGFALCKAIRQRDPTVPILFLSACREELDRILGFECGADDYLTKPFSTRELVARIKAIARRAGSAPNPSTSVGFRIGDLEIDTKALRAYRHGTAIDLSAREVKVLSVLLERAGQAVSRNDLFDACWGRDYMANSRSLDQFVATLRRKIERDASEPAIIRTVHGVGYRYDPAD